MVKTFVDVLIERQKRKEKYFKNWRFYLKKIKRETEKILGKQQRFFFWIILLKEILEQKATLMF
jgi:hypothetical protein